MNPRITVFVSPKTAGASLVSLNAALLQQTLAPQTKVGFIEVSAWSSQQMCFKNSSAHHWGELMPFYKTDEWDGRLLSRAKTNLGIDVYWSPLGNNWPEFEDKFAQAWIDLLMTQYQHLVIDLNPAVPKAWQDFLLQSSTHIVGVLTPDRLSLGAWKNWQKSHHFKARCSWVINQVPAGQKRSLEARFSAGDNNFLGSLALESNKAWDQFYLGFPIVTHKKSAFKTNLETVLHKLTS